MNGGRSVPVETPQFTREQCQALFAAVLVDDIIDHTATLPADAYRAPDPATLAACYRLSRQLWKDGTDRHALARITRQLCWRGTLDVDTQRAFKHQRAKFKQLRASYAVCSAAHRYPAAFHVTTAAMGRLQDAFRNHRRVATFRNAVSLRVLLARPCYRVIEREVDAFAPTTGAAFDRYVAGQMDCVAAALERSRVTGHEFHATRKVVSRQTALCCALTILQPGPGHTALLRYLGSINGEMGKFHDGLVERRFQRARGYATDTFEMPETIHARLTALVQWYRSG